jgi:hypothetical protein
MGQEDRDMKAVILLAALWLLCAPPAQAHGNREEGCRRCGQSSRSGNQDGDRQWGRHDGNHSGRYRPFYSYPLRDCPNEPQLYNRRTGRMEPSCEVPCVHDRMIDKD